MRISIVCVTAFATWTSLHLVAQQRPIDTFRSGREVLTIDTSVRDANGRPLTDLQPADFTVRIDGQPRHVLTARLFGKDSGRAASSAAPIARFTTNVDTPPGRVVVFAVDRDSIRPGGEKALLDTAARLLDTLSPADAAGAAALPGPATDLTRDRAVVAAAVRAMTGTQPITEALHYMSWQEALGYEHHDTSTIQAVISRECQEHNYCPSDLFVQARDMLLMGRAHAESVIRSLSGLLDKLGAISAPKHVVLISAGIPFDVELLPRYRDLADKAARSHVALFVVHLDQATFDASTRGPNAQIFGGRDQAEGLGNIASITGGQFFSAVGPAGGVFDRIATDINYFYELGVESLPADGDGKSHRVEVKVAREKVTVRAPAETAAPLRPRMSGVDALKNALSEPTDVTELPLAVATYMTHSADAEKVRVIVAASMPADTGVPPAEWGALILDGPKVIGRLGNPVEAAPGPGCSMTSTIDLVPGQYRLRTAIVGADGRTGTLEIPLRVGLRAAGVVQASDLMVGTAADGRLEPRARVRQAEPLLGMIELSSSETLTDAGGVLQVTAQGRTAPALRQPLRLRTRQDNKSIVLAEATLDVSALGPGRYIASAVLQRGGTPLARVSREFEVVPGSRPATAAAGEPADEEVMGRVGRYVAEYGQQASIIIGVEHYEQRLLSPTGSEVSRRQSTAEFALVKTGDAMGWAGSRDVIEVDGRRIGNRQNRLQALFRSGTPDAGEARRIADESARFNLGPVRRNFNEPTAALFFLTPSLQPRFAFTRKGESSVNGVNVWEVEFKEKSRPTLIRTTGGGDVPSQGTIWVVPSDGTVVRTRLTISSGSGRSDSSIDVTYARDERLGLWLPETMKERHETDIVEAGRSAYGDAVTRTTVVVGTATYSDFKRFETSATIK